MGVVLDSSATIGAERRQTTVVELLLRVKSLTQEETVAVTAIGLTEMVHGIFRADSPTRGAYRRRFLNELLDQVTVVSYTPEIAWLAGQIDGEQTSIGNIIPFPDLLIGATALHLGYSILTANLRHFRQIPNLVVIPF